MDAVNQTIKGKLRQTGPFGFGNVYCTQVPTNAKAITPTKANLSELVELYFRHFSLISTTISRDST